MWKNNCMHIQLYCFYWYVMSNYFKAVKIPFSFFVTVFCFCFTLLPNLCLEGKLSKSFQMQPSGLRQDTENLLCLLNGVNRRWDSVIPVTTHQLSGTKGSFGTGQVNDWTKLIKNKTIKQNQKLHVIKVLNLLLCSFQMCARVVYFWPLWMKSIWKCTFQIFYQINSCKWLLA